MNFINKYDPKNPFYTSTTFVGYSLSGLIVVMQDAVVYDFDSDRYKGITNDNIVKDYGNKKPVTLSFNPVYLYIYLGILILFAAFLKFSKK